MAKLDKNKTGLALGTFIAMVHAFWLALVAIIPTLLQKLIDWIFILHHIKPIYVLLPFNIVNAIMLVLMTFIMGYILGYVFALIWNKTTK